MSGLTLTAGEAGAARLETVGGKAASLGRLVEMGIPVPPFFVIASAAFDAHLEANSLDWPAAGSAPDDTEAGRIRGLIAESPLPGTVRAAVLDGYRTLTEQAGHESVSVRSSGADEDSGPASFAGQFVSILGVVGAAPLEDALRRCWASSLSDGVLAYRRFRGLPLGPRPRFGVVVQSQVFAAKAGVLFTRHPVQPDSGLAYLEANYGTGESVVAGMATPDSVTLSRSTGKAVGSGIGSKRRHTLVTPDQPGSRIVTTDPQRQAAAVLDDSEAEGIFRIARAIEESVGEPQDVEWAIDDGGGLWILQSRPQTGLK